MKVLVCGSRHGMSKDTRETLEARIAFLSVEFAPLLVIHGDAAGVDYEAGRIAAKYGVHSAKVPALWDNYHLAAGPRRNEAMLQLQPDLVIACPGGRGTADMVRRARLAGIHVDHIK